jgi:hypothetical protein
MTERAQRIMKAYDEKWVHIDKKYVVAHILRTVANDFPQFRTAEEGFELVRHNKHMVYQNAEGMQVIVSHSSSDQYQLKQVQRTLRRIRQGVYC